MEQKGEDDPPEQHRSEGQGKPAGKSEIPQKGRQLEGRIDPADKVRAVV